jgi:phosphatidylethanolamine N-methyltransferase
LTSSQSNSNVLLIGNFDIYRSSDWQLVSICSLLIIVFVMGSTRVGNDNVQILSDSVVLGTALLARVIGTSIQAFILRQQVKSRFWTNHFVQRGQTVDKAFTEWKRLSNAMDTLMNLCFYMAAYRFFSPNDYWLLSESHGNATVATLIFGVLALLGIALWAERSVFQALGAEGWFYGDFFIPPTKEMKERALVYQGIYRYVNNPDVLLGKLWLYGTALATLRVEMTVLAGLSHGVAWLFLIVVEEPHMESFYDKDNIRKHSSALTKKIKTQLLPKIAASARAMFYRQHSWKR